MFFKFLSFNVKKFSKSFMSQEKKPCGVKKKFLKPQKLKNFFFVVATNFVIDDQTSQPMRNKGELRMVPVPL